MAVPCLFLISMRSIRGDHLFCNETICSYAVSLGDIAFSCLCYPLIDYNKSSREGSSFCCTAKRMYPVVLNLTTKDKP